METGKNMVSRETQEETGAEEGVHTVMENKAEPITSGDNGELCQRATTGPPHVLVSKVLLEHNHNLSFTHSKAAFTLQGPHYMPAKPKY